MATYYIIWSSGDSALSVGRVAKRVSRGWLDTIDIESSGSIRIAKGEVKERSNSSLRKDSSTGSSSAEHEAGDLAEDGHFLRSAGQDENWDKRKARRRDNREAVHCTGANYKQTVKRSEAKR